MKHVRRYFLLLAVICGVGIFLTRPSVRYLAGQASETLKSYYIGARASAVNAKGFSLSIDGRDVDTEDLFVSSGLHLMMPLAEAVDRFGVQISIRSGGTVLIGETEIEDGAWMDEGRTPEEVFIDVTAAAEALGIDYLWDDSKMRAVITQKAEAPLPERYDSRELLSLNTVDSQGTFGTCWAFAATGALEISLKDELMDFSVDHMTMNSGFNIGPSEGGDYNMALAYLAAWKGPVPEVDDPYGDGFTDESLTAVKHLQEARRIDGKNLNRIKTMIRDYGSVESSLYMSIENEWDVSEDYEASNAAYYYSGDLTSNHDIIIVGWDDYYSRENFNRMPEQDGAFICRNSWGTEFGDGGYFYVSYEDANLGTTSMAYTRLETAENYDTIHQSDLLGWVGTIGYKDESAWFANVYTAGSASVLAGVSFYAVAPHTRYDVYGVQNFTDSDDLGKGLYLGSGYLEDGGYYTIDVAEAMEISEGSQFAVVIRIQTEGCERPVAIEYAASDLTKDADISDGEGYISYDGSSWFSAESDYECNLCLKAFTNLEDTDE